MQQYSQYQDFKRKRNAMMHYLPASPPSEIQNVYSQFDHACAITKSTKNIDLDHFIPLNWGHGGHNIGNVYLLDKRLNAAKSSKNPFKWARQCKWKGEQQEAWNNLVRLLAERNGLTVQEFKSYVKWCEQNKRTIEEVMIDPRSSTELWKVAVSTHPHT